MSFCCPFPKETFSSMPGKVKIGIIGGSGLDDPDLFQDRHESPVTTPFGEPSDALISGQIAGIDCVLLARHGRGHNIMPTNVPFRANIYALKAAGCTNILATSACGSLQQDIKPGQFIIVDQFIDMTKLRMSTFYDGQPTSPTGVCHMPMDEPFCPEMRKLIIETCRELGVSCHPSGTVLTIEGPRFSSKAESCLWHSWGAHCINMSTVPEVCLAREAGLPYGLMCMATDYDSWNDEEQNVNVQSVLATFRHNKVIAKNVINALVPKIAAKDWSNILKDYEVLPASILRKTCPRHAVESFLFHHDRVRYSFSSTCQEWCKCLVLAMTFTVV